MNILKLGNKFINMDNVAFIEEVDNMGVLVHFASPGGNIVLFDGKDAIKLLAYLEKNSYVAY